MTTKNMSNKKFLKKEASHKGLKKEISDKNLKNVTGGLALRPDVPILPTGGATGGRRTKLD